MERSQRGAAQIVGGAAAWRWAVARPQQAPPPDPGLAPAITCTLRLPVASGPKAGCDPIRRSMTPSMPSFNPHPARRPDATSSCRPPPTPWLSFNPHPARRPDATLSGYVAAHQERVSIPIRPEGRMRRSICPSPSRTTAPFQSPSGPKAGCDSWATAQATRRAGFNPHPARRPDATGTYTGSFALG